jgi:hypothetical protein
LAARAGIRQAAPRLSRSSARDRPSSRRLRRRADCREPIDGACQQPSLRGISPSAYLTALLLGEACERGALMTQAATIVRSHPWRRLTLPPHSIRMIGGGSRKRDQKGTQCVHPMIGAFSLHCNIWHRILGLDASASRPARQYGPRTRAELIRSIFRQFRSAKANLARARP